MATTLVDYNDYPVLELTNTVDRAMAVLQPHAHLFDSIAVRGVSGILVGSPVAMLMNKPLVVVRKPHEMAHSSRILTNGERAGSSYLFLDDFISLGTTHLTVMDAMTEHTQARHIGSYEYIHDRLRLAGECTEHQCPIF